MLEVFDSILAWLLRITMFSGLFILGKIIGDLFHDYDLNDEVTQKGNAAVGISAGGSFLGLILCIGGALAGPDREIVDELLDFFLYGLFGILLYQLSRFFGDRLILAGFSIQEDLLIDGNMGTGIVVCGLRITSGLVLFGALSGKTGTVWTAGILWLSAFGILLLAAFVYRFFVPYFVSEEVRQKNTAAGIGFSSGLIAMGMVLGESARQKGEGWSDLPEFFMISFAGLGSLLLIRRILNRIFLSGANPTDEILITEKPNTGAAFIEVFSNISAALVLCWCVADLL